MRLKNLFTYIGTKNRKNSHPKRKIFQKNFESRQKAALKEWIFGYFLRDNRKVDNLPAAPRSSPPSRADTPQTQSTVRRCGSSAYSAPHPSAFSHRQEREWCRRRAISSCLTRSGWRECPRRCSRTPAAEGRMQAQAMPCSSGNCYSHLYTYTYLINSTNKNLSVDIYSLSFCKYSIYSYPQFCKASITGRNFFPISVREYSTLGGIDSYYFRSTNPLSTSAFN